MATPRSRRPSRPTSPATATAPEQVPSWATTYDARAFPLVGYTGDLLAFSLNEETGDLLALLVERGEGGPFAGHTAWPGGFVEWSQDGTAEDAARRELLEETQQTPPDWMESLGTYDAVGRDPRQWAGHFEHGVWVSTGARVVSSAFLALIGPSLRLHSPAPRAGEDAVRAHWGDVYDHLPWEDQRTSRGQQARTALRTALDPWIRAADSADELTRRVARAEALFGGDADSWAETRCGARYALLHEAGLVAEAQRDRWGQGPAEADPRTRGLPLAFDHRQMMADALGQLRSRVKSVPAMLAALLPPTPTLSEIHRATESLMGRPVYRTNLARLLATQHRLVEPLPGSTAAAPGRPGRPATRMRFAAAIDEIRLDPSLRLPWMPLATP